MTHSADPAAFPARGSDPREWYHRGLTPPWVIQRYVRARLGLAEVPEDPTYGDFLREPEDEG